MLKGKYPTTSPINAIIDFQDIESGLGYVDFYAGKSGLSTGGESILSDNIFYSNDIATKTTGGATTFTTTLTFETSAFNFPRTMRGNAIMNCGIACDYSNITVSSQLKLNSGGTIINLSSEITASNFNPNTAGGDDKMIMLQLPLTETVIKEGDKIQLIQKYVINRGGSGGTEYIGHDPKGRSYFFIGTNATSELKISIPFKIE